MPDLPVIETERLRLRSFTPDDAPVVQEHCAERDVARTTLMIPHPYEDGMAAAWIATHAARWAAGAGCTFAIVRREDDQLVGAIGLDVSREHRRAEMGYVIYKPYWGRGYATEAAVAALRFGFRELDLNRIEAHHFDNNPASGRVLLKAGMVPEGRLRQSVCKWGTFHDTCHYAILRADFEARYDTGRETTGKEPSP